MRSLVWTGLLTCIVAVGLTGSAFGQVIEADRPFLDRGSSVFSIFGGGQIFDAGGQFEDIDLGDIDNQVEGEWNLGARYQYNFTPAFGLEGTFLFSPSDHEFIGPADGPDISPVDVDAQYYTVNAVWNITPARRVIPYLTGGGGGVSLDVEGADRVNKFVGNFGGGLMFVATENVAVRFDVRDYIYQFNDPDLATREALLLPVDFDETIQDLSFNAGLSFIF